MLIPSTKADYVKLPAMSTDILLTTLNARYMHTAFGLRYLQANIGELETKTALKEFTIQELPLNITEQLLAYKPKIICFSVYIWNITEITQIILLLKQIAPEVTIILGGPEVSHHPDSPAIATQADYIISGPGEQCLKVLCQAILNGQPPTEKND